MFCSRDINVHIYLGSRSETLIMIYIKVTKLIHVFSTRKEILL